MSCRNIWADLVYPLLCVTLVGFVVALCMGFLALFAAGGGHGSNVPGLLFFAPPAALWMLMGGSTHVPAIVILAIVFLYPSYGVMLNVGRRFQRGMSAFRLVLAIHYIAAAALFVFAPSRYDWADQSGISFFLHGFGVVYTVALGLCFAVFHLLAFRYARSECPYRPVLTRGLVVLCAGLVATVVFHILATM